MTFPHKFISTQTIEFSLLNKYYGALIGPIPNFNLSVGSKDIYALIEILNKKEININRETSEKKVVYVPGTEVMDLRSSYVPLETDLMVLE